MDEAKVNLTYNVQKTPTPENVDPGHEGPYGGDFSYLGINPNEISSKPGKNKLSYVDSYVLYDIRDLTGIGDYIELTISLSKTGSYLEPAVGMPHGVEDTSGEALPISDYLSDLKIYGRDVLDENNKPVTDEDGNVVRTVLYNMALSDNDNLKTRTETVEGENGEDEQVTVTEIKSTTDTDQITFRIDRSLLRTQGDELTYYIPISFNVKTGDDLFKVGGSEYANYMVSVTAAVYDDAETTSYLGSSYGYDHIIYTNAKLISEVIN